MQSVPVMSKPARRSRIAKFAQPFIVGAFGTAALAAGCGAKSETAQCDGDCQPVQLACPTSGLEQGADCAGYEGLTCGEDEACSLEGLFKCDEDGTWQDISPTCNPPPTLSEECPSARPEVGADCSDRVDELYCEYGIAPGCGPIERICDGGTWTAYAVDCRAPDTECPELTPEAGTSCFGYLEDLSCSYNDDSCTTTLRCSDTVTWVDESPTCNPPPVPLPLGSSTECPTEAPVDGESCSGMLPLLNCSYGDPECPTELECGDNGFWQDMSLSCNPPPPPTDSCPETEVSGGESCAGYAVNLRCDALDGCGRVVSLTCSEEQIWEDENPVSCNPPFVEDGGNDVDAGVERDAGREVDGGSDEDAGVR